MSARARVLELGETRGARAGRPLGALVLLGVAHAFPANSAFGLWLRLAAATLVVLLPGRLIARALGLRGAGAALAWSLAALAGALAVVFAAHASLWLAIGLLGAAALVALPFAGGRVERPPRGRALVLALGVGLGIALWHVAGILHGDALFHVARVRKLADFGALSLRAVDEFRDGGLHPGYAFPLWHGFLAVVAKLGGVDAGAAVLHEPSVLAPLALLVALELGVAVLRSAWTAGAVVLASVALYALAPGDGGSYATLALPGTTARQLLVPAVVAAFVAFVRAPSWPLAATVAVASLDLTFVHPTYAIFVALPLVAFVVARLLLVRADLRSGVAALAASLVPAGLVVAWLAPLAAETASHDPSSPEKARALRLYAGDLVVASQSRYHLRPEVFSRTGAVAVAALVLVPLAGLAARRRWAALVLGGALVLVGLELAPFLFPRFADLVSISQARRAAGFVPFALAFAGGAAVLARGLRWALPPVALAAGIVLQHEFPGSFARGEVGSSPALPAWVALVGGGAALLAGIGLSRRAPFERHGWVALLAAALFVLPVAVDGFRAWQPRVVRDGYALTPGLVEALRARVPERAVVYADLETSYRISAALPVYVANAPPAHVADTKANRPYARRRALVRFLRTGGLAVPRASGARWLVLTTREARRVRPRLPRLYADARFVLYRLTLRR